MEGMMATLVVEKEISHRVRNKKTYSKIKGYLFFYFFVFWKKRSKRFLILRLFSSKKQTIFSSNIFPSMSYEVKNTFKNIFLPKKQKQPKIIAKKYDRGIACRFEGREN